MTRYLILFPAARWTTSPLRSSPPWERLLRCPGGHGRGRVGFRRRVGQNVDPVMVAGDGTTTAGTYPQTKEFNGGFMVLT